MLKKTLIAAATAAALTSGALATTAPAAAAPAGYVEIGGKSGWNGHGKWKGHGPKRGWKKRRTARNSCQPIVRWKKVGHRHHRRWKPIVVGWDCHFGRGHRGRH